ncbi:MAG: hypothetical protein L0Z50_12165 [Verrucomicrobiales bacterium]|nr:hypothetical protein [Verrucomicrobiales bacterium]
MPDSFRTSVEQWIQSVPSVSGVRACGIRFPDRTSVNRSFRDGFPDLALDNAWRCVADTLQVLRSLRCPVQRLKWVFERHWVYCAVRSDGLFLGVFTSSEPDDVDRTGLDRLLDSFLALPR